MGARGLLERLHGVPVLGGVADFVAVVVGVYDAIGWSDPTYTIRSSEERLAEARKIGAVGDEPREGQADSAGSADGKQEAREDHSPSGHEEN